MAREVWKIVDPGAGAKLTPAVNVSFHRAGPRAETYGGKLGGKKDVNTSRPQDGCLIHPKLLHNFLVLIKHEMAVPTYPMGNQGHEAPSILKVYAGASRQQVLVESCLRALCAVSLCQRGGAMCSSLFGSQVPYPYVYIYI